MFKNRFISFEGIEGCGKSTQARILYEYFLARQMKCLLTREPGGSFAGEKIREILLSEQIEKLTPQTELLLNFAARVEHVDKTIKPALSAGKMVICDRFFDSSYAYQGKAMNLGYDMVDQLRKITLEDFMPDITFFIDIKVDEALARIIDRQDNNRYEKLTKDFHQKVYDGFLELAKNNSRIIMIDGSKNPQEVFQQIIKFIN